MLTWNAGESEGIGASQITQLLHAASCSEAVDVRSFCREHPTSHSGCPFSPASGELLSLRRHVELPTLAKGRMSDSALSLLPRAGGEGGRRPDEGAWASQEFATFAIASFASTSLTGHPFSPASGELLSLRRHVELPTLAEGRMSNSALSLLPRAGGEGGRRPDEGAWSSEEFATSAIAPLPPTTPSVPCSRQ